MVSPPRNGSSFGLVVGTINVHTFHIEDLYWLET